LWCPWQRVGGDAHFTAWANSTADGSFIYPANLALAHYALVTRCATPSCFTTGDSDVMHSLNGWFRAYNGRLTNQ